MHQTRLIQTSFPWNFTYLSLILNLKCAQDHFDRISLLDGQSIEQIAIMRDLYSVIRRLVTVAGCLGYRLIQPYPFLRPNPCISRNYCWPKPKGQLSIYSHIWFIPRISLWKLGVSDAESIRGLPKEATNLSISPQDKLAERETYFTSSESERVSIAEKGGV